MKRITNYLKLLLSFGLILTLLPLNIFAQDNEVTFIYSSGSVSSQSSYIFNDLSETIGGDDRRGAPIETGSGITKEYFIGWTTDENFTSASDFYFTYQSISDVYGDTIPDGATLYAVYFSSTDISDATQASVVHINKDYLESETLTDAVVTDEDFALEGDAKVAEAYYYPKQDTYNVSLKADLQLDNKSAYWLYYNNGHTIMTNMQRDTQSSELADIDNGVANYTYVDINVELAEEFALDSEITLRFSSYIFQPYMVLDTETREKYDIKETGSWMLNDLVSDTDPETVFTFINSNASHYVTVRCILRTNWIGGGKIIKNVSGSTLKDSWITFTTDTPITISNENAKANVTNDNTLLATGYLSGFVQMPTLTIFGISVNLSNYIDDVYPEADVLLRFVDLYEVHFNDDLAIYNGEGVVYVIPDESISEDSLAEEIMPGDLISGEVYQKDGVSYRFEGWYYLDSNNQESYFDGQTAVTDDLVSDKRLDVYAKWTKVVTYQIGIKKTINDRSGDAVDNDFFFTIYDLNKDFSSSFKLTTNNLTYKAYTNDFSFDRVGTYRYRISEDDTGLEYFTYDDSVYELELVVVAKNGDLAFESITITLNGEEVEEIHFVNIYNKPADNNNDNNDNNNKRPVPNTGIGY